MDKLIRSDSLLTDEALQRYVSRILDLIPLPIIISRTNSQSKPGSREHLHFNQAFVKELGYTMAQLPDIDTWFNRAYPDRQYRQQVMEDWHQALHQALAQQQDLVEMNALITCANGQKRWYTISAQLQPAGRHDLHIVTFQNIHDYKESLAVAEWQSKTDPLTQMSNRRGFVAWRDQRTLEQAVGLIFLDIDHFKQINDTYGHSAGDYVLCQLASVIEKNLPASACCVRWGGEEFLVCIEAVTELASISQLAECIRQQVEAMPLAWQAQSLSITVSAGCAFVCSHRDWEQGLQLADQALFSAKQLGRNRVISHS